MKKFKIPIVILLGILSFSACEKDDICIDADTPLLVIQFFDIMDTTETKDVQNLVVIGLDENGPRDTIPNQPSAIEEAMSTLVLPLRVTDSTTSFTFERMLDNNDFIEIDTLIFSYTIREVFKSRACGYVVNYDNLQARLPQPDSDALWIRGITVDTTFIENSASTHVKIFH